jgi:hypothetical protein
MTTFIKFIWFEMNNEIKICRFFSLKKLRVGLDQKWVDFKDIFKSKAKKFSSLSIKT